MKPSTALWAFVIYTLLWEALVWIGGMWVILTHDWSPWWVLFLMLLSAAQLRPASFKEFWRLEQARPS